jgi:hypothetical protein
MIEAARTPIPSRKMATSKGLVAWKRISKAVDELLAEV